MSVDRCEFWIDVGGTFTDCLAQLPDGSLRRHKLLSSGVTKGQAEAGSHPGRIVDGRRRGDPADFWKGFRCRLLDERGDAQQTALVTDFDATRGALQLDVGTMIRVGQSYELVGDEEAPLLAVRYVLGLRPTEPLPAVTIKLGTTKGTNALLTRSGARCAFVTTRGFADILLIGNQNRPRLFDLTIRKPVPLFAAVAEIDERLAADGRLLLAPNSQQIRVALSRLREQGIESLAICLLHAYREPRHEQLVESIARELGFTEISRSSAVAPIIKLVSRGDTTVVDAYLNPILRDAMGRWQTAVDIDLRMMTSAGGLVPSDQFRGCDSILSGPAGGAVGFSRVALAAGFARSIGFDMGGTSTDVARFDERLDFEHETEKAGVRIVAPMVAIETVAAGGGSICWFDGARWCVGPESAGADPGPACYGCGGPLTLTDVNVFLGRVPLIGFPVPLDRAAVDRRMEELRGRLRETGHDATLQEIAIGLLRVANAKMAKAIRAISLAKGFDPRAFVLVPFGGAAGQHACAIADELGMRQILCHPDAGLLSALGIGLADVTHHAVEGIYRPFEDVSPTELNEIFARLEANARARVLAAGVARDRIDAKRSLELRYRGAEASLVVEQPAGGDYASAFTDQHRRLYGYVHHRRSLELVAVRVVAVGRTAVALPHSQRVAAGARHDAAAARGPLSRAELRPGDHFHGPAMVLERASTTVIDPGWRGEILSGGELLLERCEPAANVAPGTDADPAWLEVFNHQFAAIAEQMGITLRNTASSVNVKERLDFSCALFDARGDLVVNAPHIPVHLGAMSETVKGLMRETPTLRPGDAYVTNDPYRGGSHLPDVTVITPVHDAAGEQVLFFTANRAHHAEIGGVTPGSMPPFSRSLAEEGVLIRNFRAVAAGESRLDELRALLESGPHPSRNVADNLFDVSAQIAANQQGVRDLQRLVERFSWPTVAAYMQHIQRAAERKLRRVLANLPAGRRAFVDHLDDGSAIAVAVTIAGDFATIDFSGTGPILPGNLNANRAIVTSAVMYCLRCLIDEDIPLNQGILAPIQIILPECLLYPPARDDPRQCAAVVGGNVETSQRLVDVLLGAFGLAAASQGTMNNVLFGDSTFGYYETICGGAGATRDAAGADAVHTHMTNTRLTDPEVLEHRFPVRLRSFSIRRGSGGAGAHRGGDGVLREIEFLREVEVSILSQRRGQFAPYGANGGQPGDIGRNTLLRADGTREALAALARFIARPGDVLVIETPGGGGWGPPSDEAQISE